MDDFAQSREPDDLFADELEPIDDPQYTIQHDQPELNNQPQAQHGQAYPERQNNANRGRGTNQRNNRGRGRGRGRENSYNSRQHTSQDIRLTAPGSEPEAAENTTTALQPNESSSNSTQNTEQAHLNNQQQVSTDNNDSNDTAATTQPPQENKVQSVRGDRSGTGPPKPTRRTEAEITELMSQMRLKNAKKAEAHERAEADQAIFLQREQQAAQKRTEERKAIRQQDMERAKNRERKIKAQGGREWDLEKTEDDLVDRTRGNSSQYSRGAYGGVSSTTRGGLGSSKYAEDEEEQDMSVYMYESRGRGRGRGSRGDRGGRGGGRGGQENNKKRDVLPTESDFPALPGSSDKPNKGLSGSTWADEMATPANEDKEIVNA